MLRNAATGLAKKHRPEPADHNVETLGREAMYRRVARFEPCIAHSLRVRTLACPVDDLRRDIDSDRTPLRCEPRGVARRLPGPAPDVEDAVMATDTVRTAQDVVVPLKFGIVIEAATGPFAMMYSVRFHTSESSGENARLEDTMQPLTDVQCRHACTRPSIAVRHEFVTQVTPAVLTGAAGHHGVDVADPEQRLVAVIESIVFLLQVNLDRVTTKPQ